MTTIGRISQIWRYPVSSLGGERLETSRLDPHGIEGDRIYGLFDAVTQTVANPDSEKRWRSAPLLKSRLNEDGVSIRANGADMVFGTIRGSGAGGVESIGFSGDVRSVRNEFIGEPKLATAPRYDRAALHLLATASLEALGNLVPMEVSIDTRRFRPNIVIDTPTGFDGFGEQTWIGRTIRIGNARLRVTEPCARCSFVALAQDELEFAPSVLHAISRKGGGFGVLASIMMLDEIRVGDALTLEQK